MTASDLKLKIFRQIDSLEGKRLEELYGVLLNFINDKKDVSDWSRLSDEQKQGIYNAIEEIDAEKGIPNAKIISRIKNSVDNSLD